MTKSKLTFHVRCSECGEDMKVEEHSYDKDAKELFLDVVPAADCECGIVDEEWEWKKAYVELLRVQGRSR